MKQRTKRQTMVGKLSVSALLLTASLVCTGVGVQNWNVNAETANDGYTLVCDSDVFTTTENYAYSKSLTVDEGENGKKGVLVTANETGREAEGSTFTLQEKMTGNFEMDFRVFSEVAYTYGSASGGYTHMVNATSSQTPAVVAGYEDNNTTRPMANDNMNPFLDLKEVGIKFTSATDASKYFIVYVRGTCGAGEYIASATMATVYIGGDPYDLVGKDRGYGINQHPNSDYNVAQWRGWQATTIRGTTFSNYMATSSGNRTETATTSNLVKFDAENMMVYVNDGAGGNDFYKYSQTADVLVRDLTNNDYFPNDYERKGFKTLSASDFANGYNVSVCYSDVTDNDCVGDVGFCDKISNPGQYGTLSEAHDRQANMVVYSVNGKSVSAKDLPGRTDVKPSDLISYDESKLTVTDNKANSVFNGSGLNIRSVSSGDAVEGVGFDFNGYMLGNFDMTFGVTSKVSYQHSNLTNPATHNTTDTSDDLAVDAYNPYADLKEVALTFTSKSNPEKFFTMYIRSGKEARAYITTARVWVNGDKDADGFGLYDMDVNGTWTTNVSKGNNSFTPLFGTSFSNVGYSKETAVLALPNKIRFDAETMKVYATSYNDNTKAESERLVRDLTDSSMITWYNTDPDFYKTITKEDFAQGYTVSVAFTEVTANDCVGSAETLSQFGWAKNDGTEGGYVTFDEAYDRYADMTIYSLNGQEFGYTSKMTDSDAPIVAPNLTSIDVFENNDITPLYYDVVDGNVPAIGGTVSVSTDNASYTEINAVDGKYLFKATAMSEVYYVKYEGFADAQGNALDSVVYELSSNAPFVKMEKGASIRIDTSDEGNNSGIRFIAYMTLEEYELLQSKNAKFFFEISVVGGKTLTAEVPADKVRVADGKAIMTGAVTGLSESHYELAWTGKFYMTFTYADGTQSGAIYADFNENTRTIKEVAQMALEDTTKTYSESQIKILKKYAGITE